MAAKKPSAAPDFDKALKELESLVNRLENEELSLEQSVEVFEKGVRLSKTCQTALEAAELRVKKILDEGDDAPEAADDDSAAGESDSLPF